MIEVIGLILKGNEMFAMNFVFGGWCGGCGCGTVCSAVAEAKVNISG